jgi:hypothetical protein
VKSRLMKFVTVMGLSVAICGSGLAQAPGVPNISKLENSTMRIAIIGSAATAAVGAIGFVVHHRHKGQSKKEAMARGQSSSGGSNSGQVKGAGESQLPQTSQTSSSIVN